MCHATLLADAEMCMSCGYEFGGSSVPRDESDAEKERREAELREQIPESIASRLARWTVKTVFMAITIGMIYYGVSWVKEFIQQSGGHGRIEKLVESAQAKDADAKILSAQMAADVVYLPSYLEDLSARAKRALKTNIELEGLEYVDSADKPRFDLKYTKRLISLQSPVAADAPDAWRDAAAVSTLIVNLPEDIKLPKDCDITALMQVEDVIGLPAAMQLFRTRTDLGWKLEHSCAADDRVRRFAARLLIARLNTTADSAASLDLLSQRTTVAEKRKSFEILQAEHGAIP